MEFMHRKIGPRAEYRQQENQRIQDSVSLADKFQVLKSLTVDFTYFDSEGLSRNSEIKYTVNLAHAKSVFRIDCPNHECVCGDFDLSEDLARAVAAQQTTATGELHCRGWLSKNTINRVHCSNSLRYKLSLAY
jgi:hypothetical protein